MFWLKDFVWVLSFVFCAVAPLWRCGEEGVGIGSKHLRRERGCLPERCRAPQEEKTPLHRAAEFGHAAVVEKLLAAGADKEAKDAVRGHCRVVGVLLVCLVPGSPPRNQMVKPGS